MALLALVFVSISVCTLLTRNAACATICHPRDMLPPQAPQAAAADAATHPPKLLHSTCNKTTGKVITCNMQPCCMVCGTCAASAWRGLLAVEKSEVAALPAKRLQNAVCMYRRRSEVLSGCSSWALQCTHVSHLSCIPLPVLLVICLQLLLQVLP